MITTFEGKQGDVGGIPVRRLLPRATLRTVGPWCFVDHAGPITEPQMQVGPHPHIGIHTVSWMISGELVHYDSLGSEQSLRPGQLNVMTAGHGIAHAEQTGTSRPVHEQHLVQLWAAQPEQTRHRTPAFEHYTNIPKIEQGNSDVTVIIGSHSGVTSDASLHWPASVYDIRLRSSFELEVPQDFEHGVITVNGAVSVNGTQGRVGVFLHIPAGEQSLEIAPLTDDAHVVIIGGQPFAEKLMMHWNFVARSKDELQIAVDDWNAHSVRFGDVAGGLNRIPAPTMLR